MERLLVDGVDRYFWAFEQRGIVERADLQHDRGAGLAAASPDACRIRCRIRA
jgi:hypothetical protein